MLNPFRSSLHLDRLVRCRDQEDRRRGLLLPHVRLVRSSGKGKGPHRGFRPRGRLGDQGRSKGSRRADRHQAYFRDRHVPLSVGYCTLAMVNHLLMDGLGLRRLRQVDQELQGFAFEVEPVEQRRSMGVQEPS
jgi:hypothetical protein